VLPPGAPLRLRAVAIVLAPLLLGVLVCVLIGANQWEQADLRTQRSVRAVVADTVTKVRTEIRNELSAAMTSAAVNARTVAPASLGRGSISADTAVQARDTGTALLDDTARPPAIIAPVYRSGATPATTAQRRATIAAYRVVPLTLDSVLDDLAPTEGGLVVRGPNHVVTAAPRTAPADSYTYAVDMDLTGSPGWRVQSWSPPPGLPGVTWFWMLGLFAVFAAASAGAAVVTRRYLGVLARQHQFERDRALVNGLAPVLQTSLDLGEVIPAAASHLVDGLGLAGLSLSVPAEDRDRQLFAWGARADPTITPTFAIPIQLEPGRTFAVGLTRGGRALGTLRIVAGTVLARDDLVALTTASELLGSTLANAESYTHQQDLVQRMRSVDELKTVFLATASHELRTPVTAIVGFTTLLLKNWEAMQSASGRALVERTLANGRRLDALIEQLLDFSRLERGLPQTGDEPLDLAAAVEHILSAQPELTATHELVTDLPHGCMVRGSQSAVERVVTNLVGNAAKYAPPGTRIWVSVSSVGDFAKLTVDDEGPGVAPEDRERVFSRFYRGHGEPVTKTRGAGIGLAIVTEYAATMSGVAEVDAAPSGGARFVVSFPLLVSTAEAGPIGESDVAHA
jgi:signal transduction histidine kinase